MTIEIPDDLAGVLAGIAATEKRSVLELVLECLRSRTEPADSPQAILDALRRMPHPSPAAVDDLEAAITTGRLPISEHELFDLPEASHTYSTRT